MDYIYIRAWCKMMGSKQYYIEATLMLARSEGAPDNAIYRQFDGTWRTFDDCRSESTREVIERLVEGMKGNSK